MKSLRHFIFVLLYLLVSTHTDCQSEKYSKIRLFTDHSDVHHLHEIGLDIDHLHGHGDGSIEFFINHDEYRLLDDADMKYEILIPDWDVFYKDRSKLDAKNIASQPKLRMTADNFGYGSMGGFYTYAEIQEKMDEMYTLFPNLVQEKFSIGTSVEGRTIWALKISDNPNVDEVEPAVYYDALHHAREPLSMAVSINYMFWLLENYDTNPEVAHIVNNRELYFVPCVNPDGYEYNRQTNPNGGGLWRKNRKNNGDGCFGVDLNRNYSFGYGFDGNCASTSTCSNTYKGTDAFSEPETDATKAFIASINPQTAFSIHSTAGYYLMPYGYDTSPPEYDIYSEWASDFLDENNYPYGVTFEMLGYTSCGTTRDYLHSQGIYGWTPEIDGSGFWPSQSEIFALVDENISAMLFQAWIAGGYTDFQSYTKTGDAIAGDSMSIIIEVKNKGLDLTSSTVEIVLESSDTNVTITGDGTIGAVPARSKITSSPFTLNIGTGFDAPSFDIDVIIYQDGLETDRDKITILKGESTVLFSDDAESGIANWTTSGNGKLWGINEDDSYRGNTSFGDSDNGNSANGTTNYFILTNNVNLAGTSIPVLEYFTKWSLEEGDIVNLQFSNNGGNSYTNVKTYIESSAWKQETIDLTPWKSTDFKMRFQLTTDGSVPGDGFYFDDISIVDYLCEDCPVCLSSIEELPYSESFENIIGDWAQGTDDDIDWILLSGATPSADTGPINASDGAYYMYIEATNPNFPDKSASLVSPCFNLSDWGGVNLSFDYHMYGTAANMNLKLEASVDGGVLWSAPIWEQSGNQGNQWNSVSIDLSAYDGEFLNLRFYGTTGETWQGDIAIDLPTLTGVVACAELGDACDDGNVCTDNDAINATCDCEGELIDEDNDGVCDTDDVCPGFDDNLIGTPCNDSDPCTTGETYDSSCGCTGGILLDDNNNGICDIYDNCIGTFPYNESFETDEGSWSQSTNDDINWTRDSGGTPSNGTGPANGSVGSWYIYIESSNPNFPSKTAGFESECINLISAGSATLSFDYHMLGTSLGMKLDVNISIDDGTTWSAPVWSISNDQGNQWNNATIDLSPYIGQAIKVRFFGITGDYWQGDIAIDNIDVAATEGCNTIGDSCDDGDACTTGDSIDSDCNCIGVIQDIDNDGVCDAEDLCPDFDNNLIGTVCDDGDECTVGDAYGTDCNCEGTFQDTDSDGICDANDDTNGDCMLGAACDDGDLCTENDAYDGDCECAGTLIDSDNDGICDAEDLCPDFDNNLIGTVCDDGDECTVGDAYGTDCNCEGTFQDTDSDGICDANDDTNGDCMLGEACDDGDLCTENDVYDGDCGCAGTLIDSDNDGICDAEDLCPDFDDNLIGTVCDDGDECTVGDAYGTDCNCEGTFQDTDSDGICDANDDTNGDCMLGEACDDGDLCTENDVYDGDCGCAGTLIDSDNDGICDAEDLCPDFDDNLIGTVCDDGDDCIVGETWGADCNCSGGILLDNNNNGICDLDEGCTYTLVNFDDFENGYGFWNDGGSDCRISTQDAQYANSGVRCVRLRDNSSTSVVTTDMIDLSGYDEIKIDFTYYASSMDNNSEDFWLQLSNNGGSNYATYAEWNLNDEFVNEVREFDNVVIQGPFSSNCRLRFRCDASGNSDWVYIDDVEITGCVSATSIKNDIEPIVELRENAVPYTFIASDINLYPIPTTDVINLNIKNIQVGQPISMRIMDATGSVVLDRKQITWNGNPIKIDLNDNHVGIYFMQIGNEEQYVTKKFVRK